MIRFFLSLCPTSLVQHIADQAISVGYPNKYLVRRRGKNPTAPVADVAATSSADQPDIRLTNMEIPL